MAKRRTQQVIKVRLSERRIAEIQGLVASWPFETKAFMRSRLAQYRPPHFLVHLSGKIFRLVTGRTRPKKFEILKDPQILTDWQRRFELSGQTNPLESWNKILQKEISHNDYQYLLALLDEELEDVHVPLELQEIFSKIYRAHIRKEFLSDPQVPKAPLVMITGGSGSGKTATVTRAIEKVIFQNRVEPEINLKRKVEERLADQAFWKSIEEVDPELAEELAHQKRLKLYIFLSRIPVVRLLFRKTIGRNLEKIIDQGIFIDYSLITPNDYQTSLVGEPGNYLKKAMGNPRRSSIRHLEEAHSAFGKAEGGQEGVVSQQRSLIDTSNIILDEIISGRRDCLLLATTDQPQRCNATIYRRFLEKGVILDISHYWENLDNLKEIIRIELRRRDIQVVDQSQAPLGPKAISSEALLAATRRMVEIFQERTLTLIPAYVRKLVHSVVEIKGDFQPQHLEDQLLVRKAFELVAMNSYGDLYNKVVDKMDRSVHWEQYIGEIKNSFSEMANNCLFYGVSEEKGAVLNGPPGGGKTFLVRAWLSENKQVHDIATNPSALQNPMNPTDSAVENLGKVYDIAKMIAPTMVFFDEGDALAPKRSGSGGYASDKLTNKFLSLLDGEVPLNKVFTALTTNRLDIMDPAVVRSKRLKVIEVSGHLRQEEINRIVDMALKGLPVHPELTADKIVSTAKSICYTPADYSAFVEKAVYQRSTEYEVVQRFRRLAEQGEEDQANFLKFNLKSLLGIMDALEVPHLIKNKLRNNGDTPWLAHYRELKSYLDKVVDQKSYPLRMTHLMAALADFTESPTKKGKVQLDAFLEAELSQEPQVGFIIGVGANDLTGVLLPIATSLTYSPTSDKILVTGAVSSSSGPGAEMEMAVKMTQQSANEALTMVENYLQFLVPEINIPRLIGVFLQQYTLHHQLLSTSYTVGGPSAGFALAINTLSALLNLPVCHDFGITGAPWIKGTKKREVGSPVLIGGHKKKTEKVLMHLRRMFMPLKNYQDLDSNFMMNYWMMDKDVIGVTHFGALVPEVFCLDQAYGKLLNRMIDLKILAKIKQFKEKQGQEEEEREIKAIQPLLQQRIEQELRRRIQALRGYLESQPLDPFLTFERIFTNPDQQQGAGI